MVDRCVERTHFLEHRGRCFPQGQTRYTQPSGGGFIGGIGLYFPNAQVQIIGKSCNAIAVAYKRKRVAKQVAFHQVSIGCINGFSNTVHIHTLRLGQSKAVFIAQYSFYTLGKLRAVIRTIGQCYFNSSKSGIGINGQKHHINPCFEGFYIGHAHRIWIRNGFHFHSIGKNKAIKAHFFAQLFRNYAVTQRRGLHAFFNSGYIQVRHHKRGHTCTDQGLERVQFQTIQTGHIIRN